MRGAWSSVLVAAALVALAGDRADAQDAGPDPPAQPALTEDQREAIEEARRLVEKGNGFVRERKFGDALTHLKAATELLTERLGDHTETADAWNELGVAHYFAGQADEALAALQTSLAIRRRVLRGDHTAVAESLGNLAAVCDALGRSLEGLRFKLDALAMQRRLHEGDHEDVARALNNLAVSQYKLGRPRMAVPYLREALEMNRRVHGDEHAEVLSSLQNLAATYDALGLPVEARPLHQEALKLSRRLVEGDHVAVALALNNFAFNLDALGQVERAFEVYTEALAMYRRLYETDHPDLARTINNLGVTHDSLGRWADGAPLKAEALAMYQRLYEGDHPAVARGLNNVAASDEAEGRSKEALENYRSSVAMYERLYGERHPTVALGLCNLALQQDTVGDRKGGLETARRAVEIADAIQWKSRARALAVLGSFLTLEGQAEEAEKHLLRAIETVESLQSGTAVLRADERGSYAAKLRMLDPHALMVRAQLALGRSVGAVEFLERGRGRSVLALLQRGRRAPVDAARARLRAAGDEEGLARLDEAQSAFEDAERALIECERAEAAAQTNGERARIRTTAAASEGARQAVLQARSAQLRAAAPALGETRPCGLEELRGLLGPNDGLAYFHFDDYGGLLLLVRSKDPAVTVHTLSRGGLVLTAAVLNDWMEKDSSALARRGAVDAKKRFLEELGTALVPESAWKQIRGLERLHVVSQGALHRVPIEALIVPSGPKQSDYWLKVGPPVVYGPSGAVLLWLRERRDQQERGRGDTGLLALADPIFDAADEAPSDVGSGGVSTRLPGTREEAAAIAKTFGSRKAPTSVLLAEEATEGRLFAAAGDCRYLHIATHGIADETATASSSRLLLSVPAEPVPGDDGALTLFDLFSRWTGRLDNTGLTVLSACSTRRGRLQEHDGPLALPLGFQFAGCPSVVATLWNVSDGVTPKLMTAFYRRLLEQDGKGRLDALLAARREVFGQHADPYYWAPFVLLGDPR